VALNRVKSVTIWGIGDELIAGWSFGSKKRSTQGGPRSGALEGHSERVTRKKGKGIRSYPFYITLQKEGGVYSSSSQRLKCALISRRSLGKRGNDWRGFPKVDKHSHKKKGGIKEDIWRNRNRAGMAIRRKVSYSRRITIVDEAGAKTTQLNTTNGTSGVTLCET